MVTPEDVVSICQLIEGYGMQVWLTGGWGIDALLGKNTRPHKDLDIFILADDVVCMNELLAQQGYQLKELWSENLGTVDSKGNTIDTAYVLNDPSGRELDMHAIRVDPHGNGIPAYAARAGFVFAPEDLAGEGTVDGYAVRCQSAENQMVGHTGYSLPDYQWHDLDQLHDKFGVEIPAMVAIQRPGNRAG